MIENIKAIHYNKLIIVLIIYCCFNCKNHLPSAFLNHVAKCFCHWSLKNVIGQVTLGATSEPLTHFF